MQVTDYTKDLESLSTEKLLKMRDVAHDNLVEAKVSLKYAEAHHNAIKDALSIRRLPEGYTK
jgi:hypothetical protein